MVVIVKNAIALLNLIAAAFRKQGANAPIVPVLAKISANVDAIANVATKRMRSHLTRVTSDLHLKHYR